MNAVRVDFGGVELEVLAGRWRSLDTAADGGRGRSLERFLNALTRIETPPAGEPDPDHWTARKGADRLGGQVVGSARQARAGTIY